MRPVSSDFVLCRESSASCLLTQSRVTLRYHAKRINNTNSYHNWIIRTYLLEYLQTLSCFKSNLRLNDYSLSATPIALCFALFAASFAVNKFDREHGRTPVACITADQNTSKIWLGFPWSDSCRCWKILLNWTSLHELTEPECTLADTNFFIRSL